MFAEVAVFSAMEKTLHYLVPESMEHEMGAGKRVLVPLGRREAMGLVLALDSSPPSLPKTVRLRPVLSVLDSQPVVPDELLSLCRWMSFYYFHPWGEVLETVLPRELSVSPQVCFRLTPGAATAKASRQDREILLAIEEAGALCMGELAGRIPESTHLSRRVRSLEGRGLLTRFFRWNSSRVSPKKVKTVRLISPPSPDFLSRSPNLGRLVGLLEESEGPHPLPLLRHRVPNADYWVGRLAREGWVEVDTFQEVRESACAQDLARPSEIIPTREQQEVVQSVLPSLLRRRFETFLLYGITGSGKTEIYLRLVEKAIEQGRGSIVLVPEIALSTQMEPIFRHRFGADLAVWHSGLPSGVRYDQWREVLEGRKRIVLGVRSAVFMPVPDLGLILVDEEHDPSYKQDDRLRYHARDVALMRAKALGIPIVLGSATPSLQSLHQCGLNRYRLLTLSRRIMERPLPELVLVDMRRQKGRDRILSAELKEALRQTTADGKQALVFLNRRGFATFVLCNTCGEVIRCSRCSVSLTFHQKQNLLRCHYCGMERSIPEQCPFCSRSSLFPLGFGTERVEEEIRHLCPRARVVRVDRDTVRRSGQMVECFNAVRNEEADILIGTQMVAKGHDFPGITLVGIVNADMGLQMSDFRAGETTVQLLMQVAGRAGRGDKPGRVLIQTYNPTHYTIRSVLEMDYLGFARRELESRERLQYPPHARLTRFVLTSPREDAAGKAARELGLLCERIAGELRPRGVNIALLGPSPAPLTRLHNQYRYHLFAKSWTSREMQAFGEAVVRQMRLQPFLKNVSCTIDRDVMNSL
ncbi:MAG TPA: primosomal protein N' [Syntrophobacteraceae bacterium]|nr:primosomal protein N' [Syntrophobacteraceae bacterium]